MQSSSLAEITMLNISFGNETVIKDLSFNIQYGEKVVLAGKSGSGKTTVLNSLMGFVISDSGSINMFGKNIDKKNIAYIRSQISWLPQNLNFNVKDARELLLLPFTFKHNKTLTPNEKAIEKMLHEFQLDISLLSKTLNEISGGQKQRIAIISCLLLKRKLIMLDEPTSALDQESKQIIMDKLDMLKDVSVLACSHDENWISRSDKIIQI